MNQSKNVSNLNNKSNLNLDNLKIYESEIY